MVTCFENSVSSCVIIQLSFLFTFLHLHNRSALRNWLFQVSKDGKNWTTLYTHTDDNSLNEPGYGTFDCFLQELTFSAVDSQLQRKKIRGIISIHQDRLQELENTAGHSLLPGVSQVLCRKPLGHTTQRENDFQGFSIVETFQSPGPQLPGH